MFTKITNQLYYGLNDNRNDSILKEVDYDERVLLILNYLYINRNLENVLLFSIDEMVIKCGYTPQSGKGRTSEQFKSILLKLHELKIIKLHSLDFTNKQLAYCEFIVDMNKSFFKLEVDIKNKILNYKPPDGKKIDNGKLLLLYCYFFCRIYKRPNDDKDVEYTGGKTEVCYPPYEAISLDVGLVDKTITKYNEILEDLKLIVIDNAGRYYHKDDKKKYKTIHESPNTYTLYRKDGTHKKHLKDAINSFKQNSNLIFIEKERCALSVKQDNGFIGNIDKLERMGKAKPEFIEKRDRLVKEREEKKLKYESIGSS